MKLEQFFRRPRTYPEIRDAKYEMAVKRAVASGKVKQVKLNFYFVEGWWNRLSAERWTVHDAMLYLTLGFGKRFIDGRDTIPKNVDSDVDLLRREVKFFRLVGNVAAGIADELERRVSILALEDTETEAAD